MRQKKGKRREEREEKREKERLKTLETRRILNTSNIIKDEHIPYFWGRGGPRGPGPQKQN